MFASQLLRILQTIPSDANVSAVEEDMNMKGYDPKSYDGRESTDSLNFGTKDLYQLNGQVRDASPLAFEVKRRDEHWNPFLDDSSVDDEHGTRDSLGKEYQNGLSFGSISLVDDSHSLSSNMNSDKAIEKESKDSRSLYIAASDLFEKNKNLFTDKIVSDCEPPEVIVRYKEINFHIVKDICVDEVMPSKDNFFIESSKDDHQSGHSSEGVELEIFTSAASSLDDSTEDVSANDTRTKEETDEILLAQESPKSSSEISSFEEDSTTKGFTYASQEDSFIDKKLPFQDFGTRSFLRSFLHSLDDEEATSQHIPDQISSLEADFEIFDTSSTEDAHGSSLFYNSEVQRGSITFNFNSPAPVIAEVTNAIITENVTEQSVDAEDVLEHDNNEAAPNISDDMHDVQFNNSKDKRVIEQTPEIKDHTISNDFSSPIQDERGRSANVNDEIVHDESPDHHKRKICDDLSSKGKVLNSASSDGQTSEPCVFDIEHRNSVDGLVVNQVKRDEGEVSFSAAGLITYTGPTAYAGSLSVRSDSSATSGRSFAFPVLQSEWNSSPVRMTNADGPHCRKHKGWRSGLLCCKF